MSTIKNIKVIKIFKDSFAGYEWVEVITSRGYFWIPYKTYKKNTKLTMLLYISAKRNILKLPLNTTTWNKID